MNIHLVSLTLPTPEMELSVFEFNTNAIKLYKRLGFPEIGRLEKFTYRQGTMWQDIRLEKYHNR